MHRADEMKAHAHPRHHAGRWGVRGVAAGVMAAALFAAGGVAGCNDSEAELERTRRLLELVVRERDDLRLQLGRAEGKLAEAQQELAARTAATRTAAAIPAAKRPRSRPQRP